MLLFIIAIILKIYLGLGIILWRVATGWTAIKSFFSNVSERRVMLRLPDAFYAIDTF